MGVLMQLMVQRLEAAAGGANGTKMYLYRWAGPGRPPGDG